MPIARTLPIADGTDAYIAAVVIAGADAGTSAFKRAPINDEGEILCTYVTSRSLTIADTRGGILRSTSAGNVALTLPNRTTDIDPGTGNVPALGHTFNANRAKRFRFQKCGSGALFVSPVNGTVIVNNIMSLAPDNLPQYAICTLLEVADNTWTWA